MTKPKKIKKAKPKKLGLIPYESPLLRQTLKPVLDPSAAGVQPVVEDMLYSIAFPRLQRSAAGMAANQWGIDWQIFVYCPDGNEAGKSVEVIFNPSYEPIGEDEDIEYEGCFSIPRALQKVSRYKTILAKYQTLDGQWHEKILTGWLARVFQHETDHLHGVLCDAKGHRTIEKIIFKDEEEEKAFFQGVKEEQTRKRQDELT